nr:hypothetical protein [Tanacetum cinerariifolium]
MGKRNSSLEPHFDDTVKNCITDHVNQDVYANRNVNYPNKATTLALPAPNTQWSMYALEVNPCEEDDEFEESEVEQFGEKLTRESRVMWQNTYCICYGTLSTHNFFKDEDGSTLAGATCLSFSARGMKNKAVEDEPHGMKKGH